MILAPNQLIIQRKASQSHSLSHKTKKDSNPTAMKLITAALLLGAVSAVAGKVSSRFARIPIVCVSPRSSGRTRMTDGSHFGNVGVIQPKDRSSHCPHQRGHFFIAAPPLCGLAALPVGCPADRTHIAFVFVISLRFGRHVPPRIIICLASGTKSFPSRPSMLAVRRILTLSC